MVAEQLSAQVWPYISFSVTFDDNVMSVTVSNDGLGPAVLRTAAVLVDDKPQASFVDALHVMIGPHLIERAQRAGERRIGVTANSAGPGSVLRVGASVTAFSLQSKTLVPLVYKQLARLHLRACYCSIEGACWIKSANDDDPRPVRSCPPEPLNLLREDAPIPRL
ncbi:MAG TPA: hypothetical protein VHT53_12715 [Candidatus Elarobacter sp.]|nr:hypothetical protein [Candidatus Elarobacter sp.]